MNIPASLFQGENNINFLWLLSLTPLHSCLYLTYMLILHKTQIQCLHNRICRIALSNYNGFAYAEVANLDHD